MTFDLKSFQKTLRYQATPTAPQLRAHLAQIADQDKLAEKKRKTYSNIAFGSGVLAFLSIFLAAAVPSVGILLLVVFTIVCIVTALLASQWNNLACPNVRYRLPEHLIAILGRDMPHDAQFETRLDFSKPTDKRKKIDTRPWPGRKGWTEKLFEDPWFSLSGRFLDNTLFTLSLTELTVIRSGWKRSRSGKSKHKSKTKSKGMEAQLLLKFPRKRYGAMTLLSAELPTVVKLPPEVVLKQAKANDHQIFLKVKIPATHPMLRQPNPEEGLSQLFTQLLLSAYHALNLSKTLSKSAR